MTGVLSSCRRVRATAWGESPPWGGVTDFKKKSFVATQQTLAEHPITRIREYFKEPLPASIRLSDDLVVPLQAPWIPWIVRMAKAADVSPSDVRLMLPSGKIIALTEHPAFPWDALLPVKK